MRAKSCRRGTASTRPEGEKEPCINRDGWSAKGELRGGAGGESRDNVLRI